MMLLLSGHIHGDRVSLSQEHCSIPRQMPTIRHPNIKVWSSIRLLQILTRVLRNREAFAVIRLNAHETQWTNRNLGLDLLTAEIKYNELCWILN